MYLLTLKVIGVLRGTYTFFKFIQLRMMFRHFRSQDRLSVWEDVLLTSADQYKCNKSHVGNFKFSSGYF